MRSLGGLGMSVGTSLAFENETSGVIRSANTFLINLRTLTRNVYDAYDNTDTDKDSVDKLVEGAKEDLAKVAQWINENRGTNPINLVVYYPTYSGLARKFNKADLWVPRTDKQKAYVALMDKVNNKVYSLYDKLIQKTDCDLPEFTGKALIITHHTVDLTLTNAVTRLFLLESYSGVVKPYTQWHTKLTGDDLFDMPFNRLTIQVFGDKSTNFRTSTHAIKKMVKELAERGKWTSATSMEKVRKSVNTLTTGIDRAGLLLMLK